MSTVSASARRVLHEGFTKFARARFTDASEDRDRDAREDPMDNPEPLDLLLVVNRSRAAMAGIDVYRYDQVTSTIETLDGWCPAFARTADLLIAEAERALGEGRSATGAEALADASLWLHFGTCVPGNDRSEVVKLLRRSAATHQRTLEVAHSSMERISTERTDGVLTGILERPVGIERPAVAIVVPGLDSSAVEFAPIARLLRDRGLATLRIDGPGQGEMLGLSGPRAEYETVLARAIDVIEEASDLDASRIAAIGLSLGGYYVPRAAAFERRLKAAVAVTGLYALPPWDAMPAMMREILILRAGDVSAARAFASRVNLEGICDRINVPLLVIAGGRDPVAPPDHARRLAREVPSATLLEVAEGDHLCANRRWEWQTQTADWLTARLRA